MSTNYHLTTQFYMKKEIQCKLLYSNPDNSNFLLIQTDLSNPLWAYSNYIHLFRIFCCISNQILAQKVVFCGQSPSTVHSTQQFFFSFMVNDPDLEKRADTISSLQKWNILIGQFLFLKILIGWSTDRTIHSMITVCEHHSFVSSL